MKNKYQRLDKEARKAARKEFREYDAKHNNYCHRLNRLRTIGLFGLVVAIVSIIYDLLMRFYFELSDGAWFYLGLIGDIALLAFCIFFIVQSDKLFKKQVNLYLIERDNDKKKKKKEDK